MKKSLAFAVSALIISIVILMVTSFQYYNQFEQLTHYTAQVEKTYKTINELEKMESVLKDAETSSRGYIISSDSSFLEPLETSKKELMPLIGNIGELLKDNREQTILHRRVQNLAYEKMTLQIENARMGKRISPDSLNKRLLYGKNVMDSFRAVTEKLKGNELKLLEQRSNVKELYQNKLYKKVRTIFLVAGLCTLIFGIWIFVELVKRFSFQHRLQMNLIKLKQNNEELEQIAFAASHDLQEPLRKIRLFSDRILLKLKGKTDEETEISLKKMNVSAQRLQGLLEDLVIFNNLVQAKGAQSMVSIEDTLKEVKNTYLNDLNTANGTLQTNALPQIMAVASDIHLLLSHLLENSIQFAQSNRPLSIQVLCEINTSKNLQNLPAEFGEGQFYHIKFIDNGTGFDTKFKDRIFKPFQRLQNYDMEKEMRRKGMGLAMCKRIMLNCGGWIDIESEIDIGTIVHLYFPKG